MTPFQFPKATDAAWVKPLLNAEGLALCNYSFPVLFCWQHAYDFRYAREGDRLLTRLTSSLGHSYLWPVGEGDPKPALDAITQDAREEGQPLRLIALTQYHKNWLEANYPDRFAFEEARDGFDYLYDIDRLADLPGKKLHAKRNHIHRFEEHYPGWSTEEIGPHNLQECIALNEDWEAAAAAAGHEDWNAHEGCEALRRCLYHQQELGLEGLALRGNGKMLAFTMGKSLGGDTYDVFFEKAYADIQGAYPMINREFARWVREHHPEIVYLNREDDMGEENLRKAKLSYHPDLLLEKYMAELKEGETL